MACHHPNRIGFILLYLLGFFLFFFLFDTLGFGDDTALFFVPPLSLSILSFSDVLTIEVRKVLIRILFTKSVNII